MALIILIAGIACPARVHATPADQHASSGAEAYQHGDYPAAMSALRDAVELYRREGNAAGQIDAMVDLAAVYQAMGQITLTIAILDDRLEHADHEKMHAAPKAPQSALPLAEKLNDPKRLLGVKRALAGACMFSESAGKAEAYLQDAEKLAEDQKDLGARAAALNLRGVLLAARRGKSADPRRPDLRNYRRALEQFDDAAAFAHDAGDVLLEARIFVNRCVAAIHNGQFDDAAAFGADGFKLVSALPDSHAKIYLLLSLGWADERALAGGASDKDAIVRRAYESLRQARTLADQQHDGLAFAYALGYSGALYEEQGKPADGLVLTRQAIFYAQQAQSPEALYRWHWQAARLLRQQGDIEAALAAYRRAVASLRNIRNDISLAYGNPNMRSSFREVAGQIYFGLADLLLQEAAQKEKAGTDATADLKEARDVIEQLKTAELEDYFQDKCANLYRVAQQGIDEIAGRNKAAIIYFIPLPDRLEMLVSLPVGLRRFQSPIGEKDLNAKMAQLRDTLADASTGSEYVPYAEEAYRLLFAPLEPTLRQLRDEGKIQTLVFVPDGALRTVPMGALIGPDGKYLAEEYAVAVSPGLTLMQPRSLPRRNIAVLENGLSEERPGFPKLAYVPQELSAIRQQFHQGSELMNEQFTLRNLNQEFTDEQFTIVHIASHGEFNEDSRKTFILTFDKNARLDLQGLQRLIEPSKFRDRPVELLTLSACETARGNDRAALGLAGVAVKAGARSAFATLWSVNDEATAQLVARFYEELKSGRDPRDPSQPVSKAEALRRAQAQLIQSLRAQHREHPYYWAPYLMIGNWL